MALDFTTGVLDPRVTITRALNTATRINSSGFIEVVNANLPRFDYDPVTFAPKGLLIEEARINRVIESNSLGAAAWSRRSANVAKTATGPDGTANSASVLTATANNGYFVQRIVATSAACITSVYVRRKTGTGQIFLSQSETTGSTFAVNGDFSSATNWAVSTGWVIDTVSGTATYIAQSANRSINNTTSSAVTTGKTYVLQYTVVANTLNAGLFRIGGFSGSSVAGANVISLDMSVGTHRFAFVSEAAGSKNIIDLWVTSAATSGALTIDDVSLFEVVETEIFPVSGWTRVALASVTLAQPNISFKFATSGDEIEVYCVQNENGSFVTSAIPTTTTSLTRNADVVTMTGTNFSDWYNASQGAFVAWFDTLLPTAQRYIYSASAGTALANSFFQTVLSNSTDNYVFSGGVQQARLLTGAITANTLAKTGLRYANADFAVAANGGGLQTQLSGSLPVGVDRLHIGRSAGGGNFLNGHIANLLWYTSLTNAELVAFTK
jgi:hypothetical protein